MDIEQFTKKAEAAMARVKPKADSAVFMTKPAAQLQEVYGPLTQKIVKEEAWKAGIEAYKLFEKAPAGHPFWVSLENIATAVATTNQVSGAASLTSVTTIQQMKSKSLDALRGVIKKAEVTPTTMLNRAVTAAGDIFFLSALSTIPFAGDALGKVVSGALGQLAVVAVEAAPAGIVAGASGAMNAPGPASAVATIMKVAGEWLDEKYVKKSQNKVQGDFSSKIINPLTQNQEFTSKSLTRARIEISPHFRYIVDIADSFQTKSATLEEFAIKTHEVYGSAFELVNVVARASVADTFEDDIRAFRTAHPVSLKPGSDDNQQTEIAILILGYFLRKDWQGTRSDQTHQLRGMVFNSIWERGKNTPIMSENAENSLINASKFLRITPIKGDKTHLQEQSKDWNNQASGDDQKRTFVESVLKVVERRCCEYFTSLKLALTNDIESMLEIRFAGGSPTPKDLIKIWSLYVGAQLVVTNALRETAIQTGGSFWSTIRNAGTQTLQTPSEYVKLIEDAGFVQRYTGILGVTTKNQKTSAAAAGKLRMARFPSNHENIALVVFSTIVVYTVDVARITLGLIPWTEVEKQLKDICTELGSINWDELVPAPAPAAAPPASSNAADRALLYRWHR